MAAPEQKSDTREFGHGKIGAGYDHHHTIEFCIAVVGFFFLGIRCPGFRNLACFVIILTFGQPRECERLDPCTMECNFRSPRSVL